MPTIEQHIKQYKRNKEFLETITPSGPFDWVITVSFYCAVHLIEQKLAPKGRHFEDHTSRNKYLQDQVEFDTVYSEFKSLFMESRKSRYNCLPIDKRRAFDSIKLLKHIEENI